MSLFSTESYSNAKIKQSKLYFLQNTPTSNNVHSFIHNDHLLEQLQSSIERFPQLQYTICHYKRFGVQLAADSYTIFQHV